MQYKRTAERLIVRMDVGDEICASLMEACCNEGIKLGSVSGIGAVDSFTVGVYNVAQKKYYKNTFEGAYEIVSLMGNVSTMKGETYLHLHMSAGDSEGKVFGGHLNEATVSATAEIIIDIIDDEVDREVCPVTGLNILKF